MKFQLSLLVIAFIGIVSAENMQPAPPQVFPALLGLWNRNPSSPTDTINNMINNMQCRLSFAETSVKIRDVFNALADDASTASDRFMNAGYHQQLQQNLNQYFQDLRVFNELALKYLNGQMYLLQYIKENFTQLFTLIKNLIVGKVYLIKAGISYNHLLPKTYEATKSLLKKLWDDFSCFVMNPSKILSYLNEVWFLLFGRNMFGMSMGSLNPLSNMLNMNMY